MIVLWTVGALTVAVNGKGVGYVADNGQSAIPAQFGEAFIDWFRARTEQTWATYPETPTALWQRGTRWLGAQPEERIAAAEYRWGVRFPPDYRLFLQRLYSVDHPAYAQQYHADGSMTRRERTAFYRWLSEAPEDVATIQSMLDWLRQGLEFDIEQNVLWLDGWGAQPPTLDAQKERIRELVASAPKLLPIYSHRYLLAEPCQAGNPILSVYQSDIIVYGDDLRSYLLNEFADLLGIDPQQARTAAQPDAATYASYVGIPFWGELL